MSWITLHENNAESFDYIGLGALADCTRCTVSEELNGVYECEFVYPTTAIYADEIKEGRIVKVKTHMPDDQLFRITSVSATMTDSIRAKAVHISYDLTGSVLPPNTISGTVQQILTYILNHGVYDCGFTGTTDKTISGTISNNIPQPVRSMLLGTQGSVLQKLGGEYEFNNKTVILHNNRGTDNGLRLRVGYNLQDYVEESGIDNTYTHVYPYARYTPEGGVESVICLSDGVIAITSPYDIGVEKVKLLDLSDKFQGGTTVTEQQLRNAANAFILENHPGQLATNIKYTWNAESDNTPINLGDTVKVYGSDGVIATAKIVKVKYDSLMERPLSIELGKVKQSLTQELKRAIGR